MGFEAAVGDYRNTVFPFHHHFRFLEGFVGISSYLLGRRLGVLPGQVHQHAVRLQGSADWNELWRIVTAYAEQMQFKTVCMDVNAPSLKEGYHARWGRVHSDQETPRYWRTEVPLSANGQTVGRLEVVGMRNGEPAGEPMAQVGKLIEDLEAAIAGLTALVAAPSLNRDPAKASIERQPVEST